MNRISVQDMTGTYNNVPIVPHKKWLVVEKREQDAVVWGVFDTQESATLWIARKQFDYRRVVNLFVERVNYYPPTPTNNPTQE